MVVFLFGSQAKSQDVMLQSVKYWENYYGTHPINASIPATYNFYYSRSASTPVGNHISRIDTNTGQLISDGCTQTAQGAYLGEEYLLMTAATIVTYPRFREVWTIGGPGTNCRTPSIHIPVPNAANNLLNAANNWSNPATWDINAVPDFNSVPAVFINRPINLDASLSLGSDKTIYIKNGGALTIQPGQTFTCNTEVYAEPGSLFQNDGQLNGGGRIRGSLTNRGVLSPGNTVGALNITGDYSASGTAVHALEISSLSSFDNLYIAGSAAINGALNVSFSGGYVPVLGNTFRIFSFASGSGTFSSASLPALPAGMYWKLNYNPTDVTLEITNINPCIPPVTPATVSGLVNVCAYVGTNTPLTYSVNPDPNATGYLWVLPPSVTLVSGQGTSTITVTIGAGFINSANKLIRVKALSACGNSADKLLYLKAQLPSTPVSITASSNNICPFLGNNIPVTYRIPRVPSASSYIWTAQSGNTVITHPNGPGENDTLVNVTFSSGFSTSVLTVQAVNDCGTSAIRSFTITRNSPATPGLISGPVNICAHLSPNGLPATYSVGSVGTVENYSWTLPSGASAVIGQGSNTVSLIYPPDYSAGAISVTASNGCGTSGPRNLSVTRLNPATPSVIDVIQVQDCPARRFIYSITSIPSNATSVQWSFPPGATLVSGGGTNSIQVDYPSGAIIGTVSVTASNNCASSSTRSTQVRIPACPPSLAGKPGTARQGIPVDDNQAPEIRIYPNPSASEFRVNTGGEMYSPVNIRVLDAGGRVMSRFRTIPGQQITFGTDLKPGIYFVEIICDSRKMIRKIVKS